MIRSVTSIILLALFSVGAFAKPMTTNKLTLSQTIHKFEYMLTSHPLAHDEQFQSETISQMKNEIQSIVRVSSNEELLESFHEMISLIPQTDKREAYLKVLESSSRSELINLISDPALLGAALSGEGSNFALSVSTDIIAPIAFIAIVAGIIYLASTIDQEEYEFEVYSNN
jgi:hypothetical protein